VDIQFLPPLQVLGVVDKVIAPLLVGPGVYTIVLARSGRVIEADRSAEWDGSECRDLLAVGLGRDGERLIFEW
jgi:hypothetical protein